MAEAAAAAGAEARAIDTREVAEAVAEQALDEVRSARDRALLTAAMEQVAGGAQACSSEMIPSLSAGHASFAQWPNGRSVRAPQARPASGSTQRNVPLAPK